MKPFKPMLASKVKLAKIVYPIYATPKLDGVRAVITEDGVMSRNWKLIPNKWVQQQYHQKKFIGYDGELIYGPPTAPDVYRQTMSACSRKDGPSLVTFNAFDRWDMPQRPYEFRVSRMTPLLNLLENRLCKNEAELLKYEETMLTLGYEGLILRGPDAGYKYGRSTMKEGGMLKFKRFEDSEARVLGIVEEMENQNVAEKNVFGRTKRSGHKANKVGKGRMGSLDVEDIYSGVKFNLAGYDVKTKKWFWKHRKGKALGIVIKYRFFPIGVKDRPRFPSYQGIREDFDL